MKKTELTVKILTLIVILSANFWNNQTIFAKNLKISKVRIFSGLGDTAVYKNDTFRLTIKLNNINELIYGINFQFTWDTTVCKIKNIFLSDFLTETGYSDISNLSTSGLCRYALWSATGNPVDDFENICIIEFMAIGNVGTSTDVIFTEFYLNENNISDEIYNGFIEIIEIPGFQIPNCFTPNGDNFNDIFTVRGIKNDINFLMQIFDEYAVEIYKSDKNYWDGEKIDGNKVKSGEIYLYKIIISEKIYKGWIYIKE